MSLEELEQELSRLSHGDEALQRVRSFAERLPRSARVEAFRNLVMPPLSHRAALERGIVGEDEDPFVLLQGDIVRTEAAYHQGERQIGQVLLVANATCDLVPGRRQFAVLLPLFPLHRDQAGVKGVLGELLSFRSNQRMYLPALFADPEIVGNAVQFDRHASIRMEDLLLAERIASLSLVGWRVLGSHLRAFFTRAGAGEVALRTAFAPAG